MDNHANILNIIYGLFVGICIVFFYAIVISDYVRCLLDNWKSKKQAPKNGNSNTFSKQEQGTRYR